MAQANEQSETGIRCLVVPLTNVSLLVPGSVVAEVAGYTEPAPVDGIGEAPWLLGRANWRGLQIPLVSVEAFFEEIAPAGGRSRMVVLKGLSGHASLSFFGVLAQQIPRLATIGVHGLEPLDDEALAQAPGEVVLAAGEATIVLDVDYVERRIIETLYS